MSKLKELKRHLERGKVYRRADLGKWSASVDMHLHALVEDGTLEKLFSERHLLMSGSLCLLF